jgi:hypothetical protein
MSEELLPKSEKRALRYDFTAKETHDLSLTLAAKTKEFQAVEEEKKTVVSQYGSKLKEIKASCNRLSNLVADGYELRDIECEVQYHTPTQGKKTIIRKDSNKTTAVETMTEWEWNLFNQPPDGENGELENKDKKGGKEKKVTKRRRKKKEVMKNVPELLPEEEITDDSQEEPAFSDLEEDEFENQDEE